MMVKDVANFHKCHLGDWDMLEYVCVRSFIQDFEFWEGGKFRVDVKGVYSIYKLGGLGACSPRFFFIDVLRLILRHSGGTRSQL